MNFGKIDILNMFSTNVEAAHFEKQERFWRLHFSSKSLRPKIMNNYQLYILHILAYLHDYFNYKYIQA